MKYKSIMVLAAMALLAQGICSADCGKNTVTVSGMGKVTVKPDVAYVTLYIKADGLLLADAVQKSKQKTDEIKKAITAKYSGAKEFVVKDSSWGSDSDKLPQPQIMKRMRITLPPNPIVVYDVIDAAIRAGAAMSNPSSHSFGEPDGVAVYGLLKSDEAEAQARTKALEDARGKAETLAALASKSLGEISSVCVNDSDFTSPYETIMEKGEAYPTKNLGIDPTEINIVSRIEFVFDLVKK